MYIRFLFKVTMFWAGYYYFAMCFFVHDLTIIIFLHYSINRNDEIWTAIGWGFGVGLIAWLFCYFDYIKRDGSFGNCLFAFLLLPITIYYGLYRGIGMCVDLFKEWR